MTRRAAELPGDPRLEILRAEFTETCAAWRMLTDVRFKLLALIPPVSALALVGVVTPGGPFGGSPVYVRIAAAVFGALIVSGLSIYDLRNSELYDDLISRGRRIERELGIEVGVFLGRLDPRNRLVSHGTALRVIWGATLAAWVIAGFAVGSGIV